MPHRSGICAALAAAAAILLAGSNGPALVGPGPAAAGSLLDSIRSVHAESARRAGGLAGRRTESGSGSGISADSRIDPSRDAAGQRLQTRFVQQALADLGFDPGPTDGLLGPKTAAAIRAFREDRGLGRGGAVDDALLRALQAAIDSQSAVDSAPLPARSPGAGAR